MVSPSRPARLCTTDQGGGLYRGATKAMPASAARDCTNQQIILDQQDVHELPGTKGFCCQQRSNTPIFTPRRLTANENRPRSSSALTGGSKPVCAPHLAQDLG